MDEHDLSVLKRQVGTLEFANPLVFGGGTVKTIEELKRACKTDVGGIEWGTITIPPKPGNEGPNVFYAHRVQGILIFTLNSLGLINPGKDYVTEHAQEALDYAHAHGKKLGINIAADNAELIVDMVIWAIRLKFDWITINGGCPNKYDNDGRPIATLCYDLNEVERLMLRLESEIGYSLTQIWWKPGMFSDTVNGLRRHAEMIASSKSIRGYIANNTFGHCFAWDENGEPAISPAGGLAGMGGPAVKPIAEGHLRMIADILPPTISRFAAGGATYGSDIADYLRHGARLVHAASVVWAFPDSARHSLGYGEANRMLAELMQERDLPKLMAT